MPKANPEAALGEFERLAAAADVNIDVSTMDEEAAEEMEEMCELLTGAIVDGSLAVDDQGRAVLAGPDGLSLTFRVPIGKDLIILANAKDGRRMEALVRFICALTSQSSDTIEKLPKRPFTLALRLAGFLAAV